MPDHSNLDPRLVSSFPTVKTGPIWGRHNEKKKKDTVCIVIPFNIECSSCHHRMNKGLKQNGRKTLGPDLGVGHIELYHFACKGCKSVITLKRDDGTADEGYSIYKGALRNLGAGAAVPREAKRFKPEAAAAAGSAQAARSDDEGDEQAALDLLRDEEAIREAFARKKKAPPPAKLNKGEIDPSVLEYD